MFNLHAQTQFDDLFIGIGVHRPYRFVFVEFDFDTDNDNNYDFIKIRENDTVYYCCLGYIQSEITIIISMISLFIDMSRN